MLALFLTKTDTILFQSTKLSNFRIVVLSWDCLIYCWYRYDNSEIDNDDIDDVEDDDELDQDEDDDANPFATNNSDGEDECPWLKKKKNVPQSTKKTLNGERKKKRKWEEHEDDRDSAFSNPSNKKRKSKIINQSCQIRLSILSLFIKRPSIMLCQTRRRKDIWSSGF